MDRSRYVPHPSAAAYAFSPYPQQQQQQQQQPYGAPHTQMPGMMPTPALAMPPASAYGAHPPHAAMGGMGQSPVQNALSPSALWSTTFTGAPIIEDLCAPPPPQPAPHHAAMGGSPPINAFPPRMAAAAMMAPHHQMHPGAMPQVQNVFGIRQPQPQGGYPMYAVHQPHPQQQHQHPGGAMMVPQMQAGVGAGGMQRVVGTYPPFVGGPHQQQVGVGMGMAPAYAPRVMQQQGPQGQQQMLDPAAVLARPRLETGFPTQVPGAPAGTGAAAMAQMGGGSGMSPSVGGASPGGEGLQPLTPVEETLREFLNPDLVDLR